MDVGGGAAVADVAEDVGAKGHVLHRMIEVSDCEDGDESFPSAMKDGDHDAGAIRRVIDVSDLEDDDEDGPSVKDGSEPEGGDMPLFTMIEVSESEDNAGGVRTMIEVSDIEGEVDLGWVWAGCNVEEAAGKMKNDVFPPTPFGSYRTHGYVVCALRYCFFFASPVEQPIPSSILFC